MVSNRRTKKKRDEGQESEGTDFKTEDIFRKLILFFIEDIFGFQSSDEFLKKLKNFKIQYHNVLH